MLVLADGPRLKRPVNLNFKGDMGQANFHLACGWLAQEIMDRTAPGTKIAIWTGYGGADAPIAVGRREMDLAITTPSTFAQMALDGRGYHAGEAFPHLKALGVLPQDDRLVAAVKQEHGITSWAELRARKPALKIGICAEDGANNIGFLTYRWLEEAGCSVDELRSWGCEIFETQRPDTCMFLLRDGIVDLVIQEAVIAPWWHDEIAHVKLNFLEIEEDVLARLEAKYACRRNPLPGGYFRDRDGPLQALDFSDFALLIRDDMDEDLAHLMAWCFTERRELLEAKFKHIRADRSPIGYPLIPKHMAAAPIPLHPGVERHYKEKGYL